MKITFFIGSMRIGGIEVYVCVGGGSESMTSSKVSENIYKTIPENFTVMVELINYSKQLTLAK